jgi:hypothetical protein
MAHLVIVRIDANIQWRWRVATGGNYVAVCDPLKLTLQSKTWSELIEDMNITLDALVSDLMESHEWDAFMKEHGWRNWPRKTWRSCPSTTTFWWN